MNKDGHTTIHRVCKEHNLTDTWSLDPSTMIPFLDRGREEAGCVHHLFTRRRNLTRPLIPSLYPRCVPHFNLDYIPLSKALVHTGKILSLHFFLLFITKTKRYDHRKASRTTVRL